MTVLFSSVQTGAKRRAVFAACQVARHAAVPQGARQAVWHKKGETSPLFILMLLKLSHSPLSYSLLSA
eukprot:scaffold222386_cov18-Prasinocladus_malaysianus.AAC.1